MKNFIIIALVVVCILLTFKNCGRQSDKVIERTDTVTTERLIRPKPKRWGVGIQAGYGINTSGQLRPYIGIGISFNVIRF